MIFKVWEGGWGVKQQWASLSKPTPREVARIKNKFCGKNTTACFTLLAFLLRGEAFLILGIKSAR